MNKITLKDVLLIAGCFGLVLIVPEIINLFIQVICVVFKFDETLLFDIKDWYNVMAIAIPSALTFLVLRQSELQQKENAKIQEKAEQISEKMLQTELRSKVGYFLPKVDDKLRDGRWIPHRHDLRDSISFVHAGDDIIFLTEASYIFKGVRNNLFEGQSICFIDKPSFNCYCVELELSEEDLNMPQIDIDFEFTLKNSKGFCFKQIINLGFGNDKGIGIINRFNMNIQEVSTDAD